MVSIQDFESCDPGSNPGRALTELAQLGRAHAF